MLKKIFPIVSALTFLGSCAFAEVPSKNLPAVEQAGSNIVAETASSPDSCPVQFPQSVEVELFLVRLSDAGEDMIRVMRPDDAPTGSFSVPSGSIISEQQVITFGEIINHHIMIPTRSNKAAQPFGATAFFGDSVPLAAQVGSDAVSMGKVDIGYTAKVDILESVCNSANVKVDVLLSNIESWSDSSRVSVPVISILSVSQTKKVWFGHGFVVGGFENKGEVDSESELALFVNVRAPQKDAKK